MSEALPWLLQGKQGRYQDAYIVGPQVQSSCFCLPVRGSVHDVKILDKLYIEPAAIYVIDLGYLDFFRMFNSSTRREHFCLQGKRQHAYVVEGSNSIDNQTGCRDELIDLQVINRKNITRTYQNGNI